MAIVGDGRPRVVDHGRERMTMAATMSDTRRRRATEAVSAPATSRPPNRAAYLAAAWSLGYGVLGLWWALGGGGFPFGAGDPGGADWMSLLGGLEPAIGGALIAALGVGGAMAGLALARPGGRRARRAAGTYAWLTAALLLFVVPDARALAVLGYLPLLIVELGFGAVDWPIANQFVCLAGGFAWTAAAIAASRPMGEAGTREASARWGRWATYAAVVLPLPYAVTRLAWALRIPLGVPDPEAGFVAAGGAAVPALTLGGMALGGALLTLGLVRHWGEVFPGWLPGLGGRPVPPALAIVPASLMSVALTVGGLTLVRLQAAGAFAGSGWAVAIPNLAFLPWGIALGLATVAYARRRQAASGGR